MATQKDLYDLLGVPHSATSEEITAAFRKAVRTCHPDHGGDAEAFRLVTSAYATLGNPLARKRYDRGFLPYESVTDLFRRFAANERRFFQTALPQPQSAEKRGTDVGIVRFVQPTLLKDGGTVTVTLAWIETEQREVTITVPPTGRDVVFCRREGLGKPGQNSGKPGDLVLILMSVDSNDGE